MENKQIIKILIICISLLSCKRTEYNVIIPDDFNEKNILIFFNSDKGNADEINNSKVNFNIPNSGIYYTKLKFGNGGRFKYYYKNKRVDEWIHQNLNHKKALILDHYGFEDYDDKQKDKIVCEIISISSDTTKSNIMFLKKRGIKKYDSLRTLR